MIFILLFAICYFSRNQRLLSRCTSFIFLLYMGFLGGHVSFDKTGAYPDYLMYQRTYILAKSNYEGGYNFIQNLFSSHDFSYVEFRTLVAMAAMVILWFGFCLLSKNPSLATCVYSITLFFIDTVQVRHTLMMSIIVLAFAVCYKGRTVVSYVVGLLLILMASSFHTTGFVFLLAYILFFVFKKHSLKLSWKFILLAAIGCLATVPVASFFIKLIIKGLNLFSFRSSAASNVINVYSSGNSVWAYGFVYFLVFFMLIAVKLTQGSDVNVIDDNWVRLINCMIPVMLVGLILESLSPDYVRIIRDTSIFVLLYCLNINWRFDGRAVHWFTYRRLLYTVLCVISVLMTFVAQNLYIYKIGPYLLSEIRL